MWKLVACSFKLGGSAKGVPSVRFVSKSSESECGSAREPRLLLAEALVNSQLCVRCVSGCGSALVASEWDGAVRGVSGGGAAANCEGCKGAWK